MSTDTPTGPCIRRPSEWYKRFIWMSVAASAMLWPLAVGISPVLDNEMGIIASDVALALAVTVTLTAVALSIGGTVWNAIADGLERLAAKVDESVDANYRRGLVNGAQQLPGRSTLTQVRGMDT